MMKIVTWWDEETGELPDAYFREIGLGEPSCWRCGWLPPVPDTCEFLGQLGEASQVKVVQTIDQALAATWQAAGRYLDRAHLADYCRTGDSSPANMVPLCHYPCHKNMPSFDDRDLALEWVAGGEEKPWWWQMATDTAGYAGRIEDRSDLRDFYIYAQNVTIKSLTGSAA